MKAYKYKIKTNKKLVENATKTLDICRELYNAALQERRDAWKIAHVSITYSMQQNQLPSIKRERRDLKDDIHSQVLQDVLRRVEKAFDGFFSRIEKGQTPGYPRFKSSARYDSFTYPQSGFDLEGDKLTLSKIGSARIRLSRPMQGKVKTCTIKREVDGWYVIFTVEIDEASKLIPKTHQTVGIDVGIEAFATLSTGERVENKRFLKEAERELKTAQRCLSRRKKFGANWRKAKTSLGRRHKKVQRQRRDFQFKQAKKLVRRFDTIKFEDLKVNQLVKNHRLAGSIQDAGWQQFIAITAFKAEEAGKQVLVVNPNGTSQICSRCKQRVPKSLADRWHECPDCGLSIHRDHNSALEIKDRSGRPFAETLASKGRRKPLQRRKQEPLTSVKTIRTKRAVAA